MINEILANNNTLPQLNEAATVLSYSDRYPCTVISVTDKEIIVQEDHAKRIDSNGMSESQNYEYSRDLNGRKFGARGNGAKGDSRTALVSFLGLGRNITISVFDN